MTTTERDKSQNHDNLRLHITPLNSFKALPFHIPFPPLTFRSLLSHLLTPTTLLPHKPHAVHSTFTWPAHTEKFTPHSILTLKTSHYTDIIREPKHHGHHSLRSARILSLFIIMYNQVLFSSECQFYTSSSSPLTKYVHDYDHRICGAVEHRAMRRG